MLPAKNIAIFLCEKISLVFWEEIKIVFPAEFIPVVAEKFLTCPVEPHEPEILCIFYKDHVRDILDDTVEEFFALYHCFLGPLAPGDILKRFDSPGYVPLFVPDRNSGGEQPFSAVPYFWEEISYFIPFINEL